MMNNKTAFLFSGQGSQYVGMGEKLYKNYDFAKKIFNQANDILEFNIKEICFNDPNKKINETKYTQPAIFIYSYILDYLLKDNGVIPNVVAGHSLGEITSLVSSGCLSYVDALSFIKLRAELMYESGKILPGKMLAVITKNKDLLDKILSNTKGIIVIANFNSSNQFVISGESQAIDKFIIETKRIKEYKENGSKIRIIPLSVSGAFHSPLMKKTRINLENFLNSIEFNDTKIPIYQNFNPKKNYTVCDIKLNLINQIDNSVRWLEIINNMKKDYIVNFIEVGPKNILTNLNKNIIPELKSFNTESMNIFKKYNV